MYLAEIGLYYYKVRFYSADLKRFLQTDPNGYNAGPNMYAYVGGDPMNFTNPSGLKRVKCDEDPSGYCVVTTGTRIPRQRTIQYAFRFTQYSFSAFGAGGGSGGGKSPTSCTASVGDINGYLDEVLGRRGPTDDYEFVRVANSLSELPPAALTNLYDNPISNDFSARGWHESNIRLPSPPDSPGGYHLHTESAGGYVYAHFDAFNGATHTFAHGMEVGAIPHVNPNITYWTIFDVFANMQTNNPGGPSTANEIESAARIPSNQITSLCK